MKKPVWLTKDRVDSLTRVAVVMGVALLVCTDNAFAQQTDEMGDGICKLVSVLTGKWLFGFTILAVVGSGAALMFGGEITDGLKKLATIITIVGMILMTSSILSFAFSALSSQSCG